MNELFTKKPVSLSYLCIIALCIFNSTYVYSQWSSQNANAPLQQLRGIHFIDDNTGLAVGDGGTILKTVNGGTAWTSQNSGTTTAGFRAVFFANATVAYAVGYPGEIYKTIDGGTTWNAQSSGVSSYLDGVYFTHADTGYVCGGYPGPSVILKTTNGGTTWTTQTFASITTEFRSIYFPVSTIGYATGNGGEIVKTTDAGLTWNQQTSATVSGLYGICFTDAITGHAVGSFGTYIKTTDGGISWISGTSGTGEHLTSVFFTDASNGYLTGWNGTIRKTSNGGTSWSAESSSANTNDILYSIYFPSMNVGYIAGKNDLGSSVSYEGMILKKGASSTIGPDPLTGTMATAYPNPFSSYTMISLPHTSNTVVVELYNIVGKAIKCSYKAVDGKITIYRDELPDGIYFYKIKENGSGIIGNGKLIVIQQ